MAAPISSSCKVMGLGDVGDEDSGLVFVTYNSITYITFTVYLITYNLL